MNSVKKHIKRILSALFLMPLFTLMGQTYNETEVTALKSFLLQQSVDGRRNHEMLNISPTDINSNTWMNHESLTWNNDNPKSVVSIVWDNKGLAGELKLNMCGALREVNCASNSIHTINVSNINSLERLWCHNNKLHSLNVTGCRNLIELDCSLNELERLDMSNKKKLESLSCTSNKLNTLYVNGCSALYVLACEYNVLSSLSLAGCASLSLLYCQSNYLTTLNIEDCGELTNLDCTSNLLINLNAGSLTKLRSVTCPHNQLVTINVKDCVSLGYLKCYANKLTTLDVSGLQQLHTLTCHDNLLTTLNVSGCSALNVLDCSSNRLSSFNVTGCANLTHFYAANNFIQNIETNSATTLADVNLKQNQLTQLDLSANNEVKYVNVADNKLKTFSLLNDSTSGYVNCAGNNLTFSTLSKQPLSLNGAYEYNPQAKQSINAIYNHINFSNEYMIEETQSQFSFFYGSENVRATDGMGIFSVDKTYIGKIISAQVQNSTFKNLTLHYNINVRDNDVELGKFTINGHDWDIKTVYGITCGESNRLIIHIDLTGTNATIDRGNPFEIDMEDKAGLQYVTFNIISEDGVNSKQYTIGVEKYIPFDKIVTQKNNDRFEVNTDTETNGGLEIKSCRWFKNKNIIGTSLHYSATGGLDLNALYSVEIVVNSAGKDVTLHSCNGKAGNMDPIVRFYPNPLLTGSLLTVDSNTGNGELEIFDISGNLLQKTSVNESITDVQLNLGSGMYVARFTSETGYIKKNKIIVK